MGTKRNMAAPTKKKHFHPQNEETDDFKHDSGSEEDMEEFEEEEDEMLNENVQVDFEARNPEGQDFHGIRKLLQQLFLKANINLSVMADTLISQNYVGSIIRQANVSDDEEDEEEMMAVDVGDDIFGIISVLNLTERHDLEPVRQFKDYVLERCKQSSPSLHAQLAELLNDPSRQIGLIINERFINIPAQIALPSFESPKKKNMKYDFTHYMLLSKTYAMPSVMSGQKPPATRVYTNEEEEIFAEECLHEFSYSVASERDQGVDGEWDDEDSSLEPQRTLLVIPADKIQTIMSKLKELLQT